MEIEQNNLERFDELITLGENVLKSKSLVRSSLFDYYAVDHTKSYNWGMKCLSSLEKILGKNSRYYSEFNNLFEGFDSIQGYGDVQKALAILKAAKDDYEGGYLIQDAPENIIATSNIDNSGEYLVRSIELEAKRNTRIYLTIISVPLVIILAAFFYFFGIIYSFYFTVGILLISYLLSAFLLKEFTPTKLPERLYEYEQNRLRKRFGIKF